LKSVESRSFSYCQLSIVIPSTIVLAASDDCPGVFQLSLSDPDSGPMFDRWRHLMKSRIAVDFQSILGFASGLPHFQDSVLDLSGFEGRSRIGRNNRVSSQTYLQRIDGTMTESRRTIASGRSESGVCPIP
jgi:hypothetical protein